MTTEQHTNQDPVSNPIRKKKRCGTCTQCDATKPSDESRVFQYVDKHDAWACAEHNSWCEGICSDSECVFCTTRPERPFGK